MNVPVRPEMLRVASTPSDGSVGVFRNTGVIRGVIVAEAGDFKDKRGHFDRQSLERIVELGNAAGPKGIKSRLTHPGASEDGLTKHLGRKRNFRLDPDGRRVRADLHIAKVALKEPIGGGQPLGEYVLDLAEEDPGAISSSLVLPQPTKTERMSEDDGEALPPLWMPEQLFFSDIVGEGDAVHGDLLSLDGADRLDDFMEGSERRIPTKLAIAGTQFLDQLFPGADRDVLHQRITDWRDRYLSSRFGAAGDSIPTDEESKNMDDDTKKALDTQNTRIDDLAKNLNGKMDELSSLITNDIQARTEQVEERERAAEIAALCKQANYPDAEQLIADEQLSANDARKKVFDWRCAQNGSLGSGDGLGGENASPIDKLRAEWDEKSEQLSRAGYTDRETWVRHQCRDKNITYTKVK